MPSFLNLLVRMMSVRLSHLSTLSTLKCRDEAMGLFVDMRMSSLSKLSTTTTTSFLSIQSDLLRLYGTTIHGTCTSTDGWREKSTGACLPSAIVLTQIFFSFMSAGGTQNLGTTTTTTKFYFDSIGPATTLRNNDSWHVHEHR
jgi:hypothetical protein